MKFNICNRFTGNIQFTAEIDCGEDAPLSIKIALAVGWALKTRAYLAGADLTNADLTGANLAGANLAGADLARTNLAGADLAVANLAVANLMGAYLAGADLAGADLRGADLMGANLARTNLTNADLTGANLARTNLTNANLTGANLAGAYLAGADLRGAVEADLAIARTRILPEGEIIGWKKLKGGVIAKLRIPADARRSHAFGRKCRAEFVDVIEGEGVSSYDSETAYAPGLRVTCDKWEDDWTQECAGGIHFFITKAEAEDY